MHEYSIAQSIITNVLELSEKYDPKKIKEVEIVVGELTFLNLDQLRFSLKILSRDTILEGCNFVINLEKLKVRCDECDFEGEIEYEGEEYHTPDIMNLVLKLKCPKCKNPNVKILKGRSIMIKRVKLEK